MINIDTRILPRLTENEFWLLIHLVKFLGRKDHVWPSNKTLCEDTKWNIDKLQRVKKALVKKGIISIEVKFNSSNIYRFHTKFIGIYNGVEGQEIQVDSESTVKAGTHETTAEHGELSTVKPSNEVLSSEVLSNSSPEGEVFKKPVLNPELQLTPEKPSKKKKASKPADECYTEFVRMWCEAYPDLGFDGVSGVKINSMIKRTRDRLTAAGKVADKESVNAAFAYVLAYVKRVGHFFHGKNITAFDQNYNSIVREIKEGKPKKQQMPSSAVFSKYSNLM